MKNLELESFGLVEMNHDEKLSLFGGQDPASDYLGGKVIDWLVDGLWWVANKNADLEVTSKQGWKYEHF
ncbi:hypothetical protein I5M32_08775 [Pedobacter sp. SD-b]|uniref:Uncharacterized protein n=1 Tax=Pedobacter segetis TaxID=2793069 RepID=A0ABS1BJJ6_9SPHI|nr:hypothetical protein [Pedobacter segetis]MBK0383050.1 hypothetical protein [Pedobacter segetis]